MTLTEQRRIKRDEIIAAAIAAWDASRQEYTCLAVIYDVIDPVIDNAVNRANNNTNLHLRSRMIRNMTADAIHERKYPRRAR